MKAVIIDDERLARKELRKMLETTPVEVIGEASNADEGKKMIEELKPDLIFLDVQMPEKNGFDLLAELDSSPKVIFVTAHDEFALKAFEADATDYLLKPIDEDRLAQTLKKIEDDHHDEDDFSGNELQKKQVLSKEDQVFLKDGDKCFFLKVNDIILFQSEGNYVKVIFEGGKILILRSLNALEERLDSHLFFRANRKHLINLNYVTHVETWFNGGLMLSVREEEHKIEVSRRQAIRFKEAFSL